MPCSTARLPPPEAAAAEDPARREEEDLREDERRVEVLGLGWEQGGDAGFQRGRDESGAKPPLRNWLPCALPTLHSLPARSRLLLLLLLLYVLSVLPCDAELSMVLLVPVVL